MKANSILLASIILTASFSSQALDFDKLKNKLKSESTDIVQSEIGNTLQDNPLVGYATEKLGLSQEQATAAMGALFKVAQDNLSADNFASIGNAIPELENYIKSAPSVSKSPLGDIASSFGKNDDTVKTAASLGYIDAAFKKIGIPKETVLPLLNTVTEYLDQNDMGTASALLKKGLAFL